MHWFESIQLAVLVVFVVCISDFRYKAGMQPLVNARLTGWVKRLYVVPIGIYGYVLITLVHPLAMDYCALSLTMLGLALAVKAKMDLGKHHTWAGYHFPETQLVTTGLYRYIKHPMYTGICFFIFGAVITIIGHAHWLMSIAVCGASAGIVLFLVLAAWRENKLLVELREEEMSRIVAEV